MAFIYRPELLASSRSCSRCQRGAHHKCLQHPAADGAHWYDEFDEDGNPILDDKGYQKRRLYKRDPLTKEEIPREPCECMVLDHIGEPGTCSQFGTEYHVRCGRPAKGTITLNRYGGGKYEIEVCGIHLAAQKRKDKTNEEYRAQAEAMRERALREKEIASASTDWAQKIREEFGLPVEALPPRSDMKIRVALSPEEAYAVLDKVRSLLDEVFEEHPFRKEG